jgi:hypothetical protein
MIRNVKELVVIKAGGGMISQSTTDISSIWFPTLRDRKQFFDQRLSAPAASNDDI